VREQDRDRAEHGDLAAKLERYRAVRACGQLARTTPAPFAGKPRKAA